MSAGSKLAVVATTVVLCALPAAAARLPDELVLERLGRERGFPSETITALLRDRDGFLWVGSREGLAVYDGYGVRVFEHAVSDPGSLSDDAVRRIYQDREGRLWVGTDAGGLQRLDRATGKFTTYRHDPADPASLGSDGVYAMAEGADGALWVGTQKGLDRLDVATGRFERFEADRDDPAALPNPWIYDLLVDREGRVWVATVGGGVARLDPASRTFTRVPFDDASGATARSTLAFWIVEGPDGEPWFAVEDGVFRYDAERAALERVPVSGIRPGPETEIVTAIAFDGGGTLWATTWNGGLVGYDPATGRSHVYRHDPGREDGLATDRLACITVDAAGDVWIGTWGGGIHRFNADAGLFTRIPARAGNPAALPYREVTSVLEDREDRLWVGTWGEGLVRRDTPGGRFSRARRPPGADPMAMSTPLALAEDPDGSLWTGTMAGLFRVGRDLRVEHAYRFAADRPEGIAHGYVNAVALDGGGRLWVGTGGGGLQRLEPDGTTFEHFRNDPADPASLGGDFVTALLPARDGALWVGTRSAGLDRLDPATGRFERFAPDPHDPRSLGHHTVTSILEDREGRVWAGTAGGGLARLERDAAGWRVTRVTVEDGLVNASVVSLREDDDGSLWIGTRRGLSRYDPGTGRFHNYGPGDGLPSLEFRPNASSAGKTTLWFGTLGGVLGVARGSSFETPAPTPTLITAIRTLEGPWPLERPAWETASIEAPYGTPIAIELGVLDLHPPHRFAYRLEGESDSWVDLGNRREITFAGLQPGRYVLTARGLNARGVWSTSELPLRIRIVPPFWMTWWFRLLGALALVAVAWTWIRVRFAALERRNRELEALHRDREAALAQARASEEALHGAYERLRALTRRLEDAKEEERRRIARELHDEMGQALSAIKINLKALGRLAGADGASERVADALALVDAIIGNVRELSLDLRPPLLDELGLVAALRGYAEGQSVRSGVEIAVEANADGGDIPAEIAITAFRIVQESIHNVLRHARARRVTVSVRRDPARLALAVRDDGAGFDLDAALERAATGRNLGLLGMRERVEALGGSFEIETAPGQGTAVHARIPLDDAEV